MSATPSVADLLDTAKARLAAGDAGGTAAACRAALAAMPEATSALALFGIAGVMTGKAADALPILRLALAVNPDEPALHNAVAIAFRETGNAGEARRHAELAVSRDPDRPQYLRTLAESLKAGGDLSRAEIIYRRLLASGAAQPKDRRAYGFVLTQLNRPAEAAEVFAALVQAFPDNPEFLCDLGYAHLKANQKREAVQAYERALAAGADKPEPYVNLGSLYYNGANTGLSVDITRRGLDRFPEDAGLHVNHGLALVAMGRVREGVDAYLRCVELTPENSAAHSNALFSAQYLDTLSSGQVYEMHREWVRRHAARITPATRWPNAPEPGRRLRIGYVSPDFRAHAVSFFLIGLYGAHDRAAVEIFSYSTHATQDPMTRRFQEMSDHWREVADSSDQALIEQVRADGIDILVDLAGHTGHNRLLVFAAKPAPVQATWLGYPTTTGLDTVDWRISDPWLTPPDAVEQFSERLYRLPRVSHCYTPNDSIVSPVAPPPFERNGHITFGSFNNFAKISDTCLANWAKVLAAVPEARLRVKSRHIENPQTHALLRSRFAAVGGDVARLDMVGGTERSDDHLKQYGEVDIALDTFPYGGMTTTCEALLMGVPVLTVSGERTASRYATAVLSCMGLEDLVAGDADQMAAIAARLAGDREGLRTLRASLRERMLASPLGDATDFTRAMEDAYRDMWAQWCATQTSKA